LPGVFSGRAILFVRKAGFLEQGHLVNVADVPIELTLERALTPGRTPAPRPAALSRPEERALAFQLLQPFIPRIALGDLGDVTNQLANAGPRIAPALALEYAERGILGAYGDYARTSAAEGLLEEDLEEGLAVAETIGSLRWRVSAYLKACDRVPSRDRVRKTQLLDVALVYARSDPSAVGRLDGLGQIALRWLDLGERHKATRILREGEAIARSLPSPRGSTRTGEEPHARGRFAAKLARIDAKTALELASDFPDPYNEWYLGGVALGLAEHDPAEAERVAGMLPYGQRRLPRLCRRLAPLDLPRARRLAESLDDRHEHAKALAGMAQALARSDPKSAAALLEEALAAWEASVREGRSQVDDYPPTCVAAAGLLPLAEQLGAEHLHRCFWRVVALRPPRPARGDASGRYETTITQLAIALARYDAATARHVLEPALRRLPELFDPRNTRQANNVFAAAVVIDPKWVVSLLDQAPDRAWPGGYRPRDQARLAIADVLAYPGESRWEHLRSQYLYQEADSTDDER
jgi:hypothetical protein